MKTRTVGISPKLIAAVVTAAVVYLLTRFGIEVDADLSNLISLVAAAIAGYVAPAGELEAA